VSVLEKSIVLIGMMGAGKSSVGRCLQRRISRVCFDTDELVAARAGMSITEIFSKDGENRFRDLESEVLRELSQTESAVIVTGGGIVLREDNVARLKELGMIVWLEAEEAVLFERASRRGNRPLLQTADPRATLSELLRTRMPLYEKAADFRVDTTRLTPNDICDIILAEIATRVAMPDKQ
jgi:shikimate kinase